MIWTRWAVDASMDCPTGTYCFVPVEGEMDNPQFVVGMSYVGKRPPQDGEVVCILHEDGQEAVERWIAANGDRLRADLDAAVAGQEGADE